MPGIRAFPGIPYAEKSRELMALDKHPKVMKETHRDRYELQDRATARLRGRSSAGEGIGTRPPVC